MHQISSDRETPFQLPEGRVWRFPRIDYRFLPHCVSGCSPKTRAFGVYILATNPATMVTWRYGLIKKATPVISNFQKTAFHCVRGVVYCGGRGREWGAASLVSFRDFRRAFTFLPWLHLPERFAFSSVPSFFFFLLLPFSFSFFLKVKGATSPHLENINELPERRARTVRTYSVHTYVRSHALRLGKGWNEEREEEGESTAERRRCYIGERVVQTRDTG